MAKKVIELTCKFIINYDNEIPFVEMWNICSEIENKKYYLNDKTETKWFHIEKEDVILTYGKGIKTFMEFITNIKMDVRIVFQDLKDKEGHFIIPELSQMNYKNISLTSNFKNKERVKKIYDTNEKVRKYWNKMNKENLLFDELYKLALDDVIPFDNFKTNIEYNWFQLHEKEYRETTTRNKQIISLTISSNIKKKTGIHRNIYINNNSMLFSGTIDEYKKQLGIKHDKFEDTYILYLFRKKMEKILPKNRWKGTSASTAYNEFIDIFGNKMFKKELLDVKQLRNGREVYKLKNDKFSKKYKSEFQMKKNIVEIFAPTKWLDRKNGISTNHRYISQKYFIGGLSWVNEMHRGAYRENVNFLDITSAHAYSMICGLEFPIGVPVNYDKKEYKYKLMKITIKKTCANENGLPFMYNQKQLEREYLKTLKKGTVYYIDSNLYDAFVKYYCNGDTSKFDMEVEYSFRTMNGQQIFGDYVNKWFSEKQLADETRDEFLRRMSKLMLNELFGKFATKKEVDTSIWNDKKLMWEDKINISNAKFYLPWAVCITSITRLQLINAVDTNNDRVIGGDTDSLIWIGDIKDFKGNISNGLGGFKKENKKSLSGIMRRPKQYLFENDKERKVAIAGVQLVDNDIKMKHMIYGKKKIKQMNNTNYYGYGRIKLETVKELKPIWDFKPLKEQYTITKQQYLDINKDYLSKIR